MHHQRHFDRVRGLLGGQTGVPAAEITLETRLVEDLGMDSHDGAAFLAIFADEFRADLGRIALLNYFDDQPWIIGRSPLMPVVARLSPRFRAHARHCARRLRTVRVRDLVASAQARRWIAPAVPRRDADPLRLSLRGWLVLAASAAVPLLLGLREYGSTGVSAARAVEAALWALLPFAAVLGVSFLSALRRLCRLDAAASFEERALSATD